MKIKFLGTSSGTPTKDRNVSGIILKTDNTKEWFLIDCGESTQHQLLYTNLSLNNLSAIFITHVHGDHCFGLPGLLASISMTNRNEPITIIGPVELRNFIDVTISCSQMYLPYEINFIEVEKLENTLLFDSLEVERFKISHRVPSYAFRFVEKNISKKLNTDKLEKDGIPKGPVWGQLQRGEDIKTNDEKILNSKDYLLEGKKPRIIVIAGDNDKPELLKDACMDADLLVHEATFTKNIDEKKGPMPQHCTAEKIAVFAEKIKLKNLVLTHFSPRYQSDVTRSPSISDIETEARNHYSGNLFIANDFDSIKI